MISSTRTPVRTLAPAAFAPAANESVSPVGSMCPSVGTNWAPSTRDASISGKRSSASSVDTISTGSPKDFAHPAWRASASIR